MQGPPLNAFEALIWQSDNKTSNSNKREIDSNSDSNSTPFIEYLLRSGEQLNN